MNAVDWDTQLVGEALIQELFSADKDKEKTMYMLLPHRIPRMMEEFMRFGAKYRKKENGETHRNVPAQGSPSW